MNMILIKFNLPMVAYFYKACHVVERKVAYCVVEEVANFGCNVVGFEQEAVENHQVWCTHCHNCFDNVSPNWATEAAG